MEEKIKKALEYIEFMSAKSTDDIETIKNDASNIFADSFEEYMIISEAVGNN